MCRPTHARIAERNHLYCGSSLQGSRLVSCLRSDLIKSRRELLRSDLIKSRLKEATTADNTGNPKHLDKLRYRNFLYRKTPPQKQTERMERKCLSTKRFLNKPHIARCLGNNTGVHAIDPVTGRMLTAKLQHNRHKHPPHNSHIRAKPDLNTTLPVRQTASIFKQPVTKVTNHPTNKVKTDPHKALEQPKQLFWEKKLSGLNAFDIAEELVKSMDLPKGLQGVGPVCSDRSLISAITSALHTSPKPVTGQHTSAVEKNPGVWLNTTQPLCKAFMVTDDDIRKQEDMVHNVRRRLEKALMADMLAHLEDRTAEAKSLNASTIMEVDQ